MKKLLFIFFVFLTGTALADNRYYDPTETATLALAPAVGHTTKYVDGSATGCGGSGCLDTNNGNTFATAYKTITKAKTGRAYGDRVLIGTGTYKEEVRISTLTGTGSEDNRFIIGPYGNGEVIIDRGLTKVWDLYATNVYHTTTSTTFDSIIMDDNFRSCRQVWSLASVDTDGEWYQSGTDIYLYSASGTPESRSAMCRYRDSNNTVYGIFVTDMSYVSIYGLTILNAPSLAISFYHCNYGVVEQCKIKYSGKNGIVFGWSYNKAIKNFVWANCMQNWPRGRDGGSTGGWDTGINIGNYGTAQGNIVANNGGEGINIYGNGTGPILIEDNIVYDNYSVNIYPDSHPHVTVRNNFIFCSGINATDVTASPPTGSTTASITRKLRPIGIMQGDESAAGGGSHEQKFYNNLILACREGINGYHQATGSGWINDYIFHNTIILPNYDPTAISDTFYGIDIGYDVDNIGTLVENNIIVGQDANGILVKKGTDTGTTWEDNTYYHPNNATPFIRGSTAYNFADWKTQSGQDANSKNEDPLLTNSDWSTYD